MIDGRIAAGYEPIAEAFERNLAEHHDHGAAFAAVVNGEPVVDVWGGMSRAHLYRGWTRETIQMIFSGTKGLVGVCILKLVEDGDCGSMTA